MVRSVSSGFSYLVFALEQIENCLKNGKIQDVVAVSNGVKSPYSRFTKNKEGEANAATIVKGNIGAYQVPYYQVEEIPPNWYSQQAYIILVEQQPIQYK